MASFRFLHAADLHLDSPLLGLRSKSEAWAARVERASREAFDALVALAKSQQCQFVVLAGDVFDGALRNFQTGLYFMAGMRRLGEAGIEVFVILGNHDAENTFASQLPLAPNVKVFAAAQAQSFAVSSLPVWVHGQSFAQRDVTENLARDYPAPRPGAFNIGMLHTACQGAEGHAMYAPCTVEQLVHHGYDYWALGHIHTRAVLHTHPHIVYPGNLQGRSPKETGGKGASVVHVDSGRITGVVHHDLDVVRWQEASIDVREAQSLHDVIELVRAGVQPILACAQARPTALRLHLVGQSPMHAQLQLQIEEVRLRIQTLFEAVSGHLWLERVRLATRPQTQPSAADPTVAGALSRLIDEAVADGQADALVQMRVRELLAKLPQAADAEGLAARLTAFAPSAAAQLAQALVDGQGEGDGQSAESGDARPANGPGQKELHDASV